MARFPSLPDRPVLGDVFQRFPDGVMPLLEYHDVLLRGPSPLTVAERELIAAYVSGVNACSYCEGAHREIAAVHGYDPAVFARLLVDPAAAGVAPALLPVLAFVRKLTETPSRMTDADAAAVYAAGWTEEALFHAIAVCAIFNFMNRIVEGCGVKTDDDVIAAQLGNQLARRAQGDHLAVIDDRHTIAQALGLVHVVRRQQDRSARGAEVANEVPQLPARLRIEPGGRLVEEQEIGIPDQRARDRESLALPAGQIHDP